MPTYETRRGRIENSRVAGQASSLPSHGFAFVRHDTTGENIFDEDEVFRVYYPETEALIRAQSGARRVVVFDHTLRTANDSPQTDR